LECLECQNEVSAFFGLPDYFASVVVATAVVNVVVVLAVLMFLTVVVG